MVILFSNRKSKLEKEIIEILTTCGADIITDKSVSAAGGFFTVAVCYKRTEINIKNGIALFLDDTDKFKNQILPKELIGICEDNNIAALKSFKSNGIAVITCGNSPKNTVTISSIEDNNYLLTLQREILDINGKKVLPKDYKITLTKAYSPTAVMLSGAILCLINRN